MGKSRSSRVRGSPQQVDKVARALRRTMTSAEKILWEELRGRRLNGYKFRRQHPVGGFIVDFYCPLKKLVIEVDGQVHDTQQEYDESRCDHLHTYGYRVLRFRNEEVTKNLPEVLDTIRQELN